MIKLRTPDKLRPVEIDELVETVNLLRRQVAWLSTAVIVLGIAIVILAVTR